LSAHTAKENLSQQASGLSVATFEQFSGPVLRFLSDRTAIPVSSIGPDFDFVTTGLLDSVSTIDLFFFIQDTFDRNFLAGDIKLPELNTPAKLYRRYLDVKQKNHDAA
jgi:acyl carrier protein